MVIDTVMQVQYVSRRCFLKSILSGSLSSAVILHRQGLAQQNDAGHAAEHSNIASVRYLGNQFLKNRVGVTGADGATSTVLPSGDTFWAFGDTVEGEFKSIRGLDLAPLQSSTAAIVPQQDASHGIQQFRFLATDDGKKPRQILPFAGDEKPSVHRLWPIHGVSDESHLYLFYHRITLLEGVDVFVNFQLDGMGVAKAKLDEFQFTRLTAPDGTHEFWKGDEPSFGVFVERDDDYVYLWGCLTTGMHLARTKLNTVDDLTSYEYLVEAPTERRPNTALRWSKNFAPTAVLFDSVPNEMSAAYNSYLGKHVAFHSLHREHKIVMRTAAERTGPWTAGEVVYRPEQIGDDDLIYAAKEHPELAREDGRVIYVTFINSATYVPQMIEITLK